MLSKFEKELANNGIKVVTVSEQSISRDMSECKKEIMALIEEHSVTHIESFYRYLEEVVLEIVIKKDIKMLSSFYDAVFVDELLPRHIGVGEVVELNNEPEIDEGDVIVTNITPNYLPHFA